MAPKQNENGNFSESNMDRLRELTDLLTYDDNDTKELLVKVNDELAEIREELNNGKENTKKIDICKKKVESLISELRNNILKNVTKEQ